MIASKTLGETHSEQPKVSTETKTSLSSLGHANVSTTSLESTEPTSQYSGSDDEERKSKGSSSGRG